MPKIKRLTDKIVKFSEERNWKQFHKPKDLAISLSLEAAEVLEHFQWKSEKETAKYIKNHKEEIGDELADVFNYVLLMSHYLDIDIVKATENKLEKTAKKYPIEKSKGSHKKYTDLN